MSSVNVASSRVPCRSPLPADGKKAGQSERRAFPRLPVRFPVLHGIAAPTLVSLAADISDDGMALVTRTAYPIDAVISLELRIPGGPVYVKARVRHCRTGTAGVQFLNISRQQRLALLDFCLGRTAPQIH